jgi:hypothetical protein
MENVYEGPASGSELASANRASSPTSLCFGPSPEEAESSAAGAARITERVAASEHCFSVTVEDVNKEYEGEADPETEEKCWHAEAEEKEDQREEDKCNKNERKSEWARGEFDDDFWAEFEAQVKQSARFDERKRCSFNATEHAADSLHVNVSD